MSTIYIDEQGAVLHHHGDEIQVEKEHVVLAKLPLTQIDRIVLAGGVQLTTLINRGELSQYDFRKGDDGGYFLVDNARKTFYAAYEHKVRTEISYLNGDNMSYRRIFFRQAESLARVIKGDDLEYHAFLMR